MLSSSLPQVHDNRMAQLDPQLVWGCCIALCVALRAAAGLLR